MAWRRRTPDADRGLTRSERAEIAALSKQLKDLRKSVAATIDAAKAEVAQRAKDVDAATRRIAGLEEQLRQATEEHSEAIEAARRSAFDAVTAAERRAQAELHVALSAERLARTDDLEAASEAHRRELHETAERHAATLERFRQGTAQHFREQSELRIADIQALDRSLRAELDSIRRAQAASSAALAERHSAALEAVVTTHSADLAALDNDLTERLAALNSDLTERLATQASAQESAVARLRAEHSAATAQHESAIAGVRDLLAANSREHSAALAEARQALTARLDEQREQHGELSASVEVAANQLALHREEVDDRFASTEAVAARIEDRQARDGKRIEQAVAGLHRVDLLADSVDGLSDRVTAAEMLLKERDTTDFEAQLERMEAFERLAAETNPDQFAQRSEVEALKQQLDEIRQPVMETGTTND